MVKRVVCSALNLFVFMLCIQLVSSQLPADQVSAMTSIYEIIQNNTASSFLWANVLKDSSPCSWRGVVCSNDNSSITSLSLRSFSVSTSDFLPFICNISTLESIDVSHNQLSSIPDGFYTACGKISGLKLLNFSGDDLSGSLPSFNVFTVLEKLDFSRNSFSGEISLQFDGLGSFKKYGSTKRVTAAGNVYSFGVVLLELVTGKPAVSEGSELAKWVLSISEQGDRWDEILDSSVSETSVDVRNQMVAVGKVALACINTSPEMRPNSATLLQMLQSIRSNNQG